MTSIVTIVLPPVCRPYLRDLAVVGPLLTLGHPGALDASSTPSPRDFVVLTAVPGGEARCLRNVLGALASGLNLRPHMLSRV